MSNIKKTQYVLELKNVTKTFKNFKALDNVSFKVKQGERVALIGANGAGKTTVTEIIAGIAKPTSGTITYGFEYDKTPSEKIGMQFQVSSYPSGLTVKDMISFAIELRRIKIDKEALRNLLTTFQMDDFYNRKAKSLSGGQRQKLNILMSVLHKPDLIIFDELSTGLDALARETIIEFANTIIGKESVSAIFISHHMEEVEKLCDRVIVLDQGKIIEETSVAKIKAEYHSLDTYIKKVIRKSQKRIIKAFEKKQNKEVKHKKTHKNKSKKVSK